MLSKKELTDTNTPNIKVIGPRAIPKLTMRIPPPISKPFRDRPLSRTRKG